MRHRLWNRRSRRLWNRRSHRLWNRPRRIQPPHWHVELGAPLADEPETGAWQRGAEALSYLQNQKERMRDAEYRRQGLPITSSHIESTIKQVNQRVKGTEKFWSPEGAEAVLQLRADTRSETAPRDGFWERRQAGATGQRRLPANC